MTYSEEVRKNLSGKSVEALKAIPEEQKPVLAAAHDKLFGWLVDMERSHHDPDLLVSDDMANSAASAAEIWLSSQTDTFTGLKTAWGALTATDKANFMKMAVVGAIHDNVVGAQLMSKQKEALTWDVTAFITDGRPATVFAKVGREHYQPIGFDDGTHYVATETSKTLWVRDFAFALMLRHTPAFKVDIKDIANPVGTGEVTARELQGMKETSVWLEEELALYGKAPDDEARTAAARRVYDTIGLVRVNIPRLDRKLEEVAKQNPELGKLLEFAEPVQLAHACIEFMKMHIADAQVAAQVGGTIEVEVTPEVKTDLYKSILSSLQDVLTPDNITDSTIAIGRLTMAKLAAPEIYDIISKMHPDATLRDGIVAAIEYIKSKLA